MNSTERAEGSFKALKVVEPERENKLKTNKYELRSYEQTLKNLA